MASEDDIWSKCLRDDDALKRVILAQSCSTDNSNQRFSEKGWRRRSSTSRDHPCLTNSDALDSTGSRSVAYLLVRNG